MLRTLDSMPKRARNTLLGNIADPKFVPPARPEVPATQPVTVNVPIEVLGRVGSGPGEVTERIGEGPRAGTMEPVYEIRYQGV
jgi:hypothetical protein